MTKHVRLFVALPVSPDLKEAIQALPRAQLGDARWTHSDDLHITLRFLGEVPARQVDEIHQALLQVRRPPFHIDVNGLEVFENNRQSVLYAHVESIRKITTLCAEITDRLTPLGFDFGTRPFVPHVTIARVKSSAGLLPYTKRHGQRVRAHWRVDSFSLMQSGEAGIDGRHYKALFAYGLF